LPASTARLVSSILSAKVINALAAGRDTHVPYRDSALTKVSLALALALAMALALTTLTL
jgi:hypothetical protein